MIRRDHYTITLRPVALDDGIMHAAVVRREGRQTAVDSVARPGAAVRALQAALNGVDFELDGITVPEIIAEVQRHASAVVRVTARPSKTSGLKRERRVTVRVILEEGDR